MTARISFILVVSVIFSWSPFKAFAATPDITVAIDRKSLIEIYEPGEPPQWRISVDNRGGVATKDARLSWEFEGWNKKSEEQILPISVDPGSKATVAVNFELELLGAFELRVKLIDSAGKVLARDSLGFAVNPSFKSRGQFFRYGVSTHTAKTTGLDYQREIELADVLGVDITRDEPFKWDQIEPDKGAWKLDSSDKYLADLRERNIELNTILCYGGASWVYPKQDRNRPDFDKHPPNLDAFLNYVETVARRYADKLPIYWEIWNEPDLGAWLGSTEEYATLFKESASVIRAVDNDAKIMNGGFGMVGNPRNPNFLPDFIRIADKSNWNIWAYHNYHTFSELVARAHGSAKTEYENTSKEMPIWLNESGFTCVLPGGEREQAINLVKKVAGAPWLDIAAYFWYDLRNDGPNPHESEENFGLVRYNCDPKPAFAAYQTLIRSLSDAKFFARLPQTASSRGLWAFGYDGKGKETIIVAWNEGGVRPFYIRNPAPVKVTDLMGNPLKATKKEGGVFIDLGDEPVYIFFQGEKVSPSIDSPIVFPSLLAVTPGKTEEVTITVNNIFDHKILAAPSMWTNAADLNWDFKDNEIYVAPNSSRSFACKIFISTEDAKDFRINSNGAELKSQIIINVPSEDLQLKGDMQLRFANTVTKIAAEGHGFPTDKKDDWWSVRLRDRETLYNIYNAQPRPELHWRGEDDLSADVRLAYTDESLLLEVAVKDDIHNQSYSGATSHMGDSLQIAFRLDDVSTTMTEVAIWKAEQGESGGWVHISDSGLKVGELESSVLRNVTRTGTTTTYQVSLPWKALGLTRPPAEGISLSLLVNDNDGLGRKQWMELSPGIGKEKDPSLFPVFIFR